MTNGKRAWLAAAAIAAAHALGVAALFSPISALWSARPLVEQDWGLHYHHLESMLEFWRRDGRLWGYSPLFMAGYPSNTIQDASAKLFEFAALALRGFGHWRVFKLLVFLSVAAWPLAACFAARGFFGADSRARRAAPVAAAIAAAAWWNSLAREALFYGMIGFPLACVLALAAAAALHRLAEGERRFSVAHAAWLGCCAALPVAHLQGAFILVAPWAVIVCAAASRKNYRALAWALAGPALALASNSFWIKTYLQWRGFDASAEIARETPYFASLDPLAFLKDYFTGAGYWTFRASAWEKGLRLALAILGAGGIAALLRDPARRREGAALGGGICMMFLFAYFGSFWLPMRAQQPMRFKIALDLFLAIPAAWAIAAAIERLRSRGGALAIGAAALGAACFLANLIQTESRGDMRPADRLPPRCEEIISWLRERTSPDERILFEESGDESGFIYGGVYLSAFAAHLADRQLIGGPANAYNDRHHVAELHSGLFFKTRRMNSMSEAELRQIFEDYNIGACVVFDEASVAGLLAFPNLAKVDRQIGPFWLMKTTQPRSWIRGGSGKVEAGPGEISCELDSGARPKSLSLKYHWVKGLACDPPAKIEPVASSPLDPIPFIRVVDPPPKIRIRLP